jgi:hypothetical protein
MGGFLVSFGFHGQAKARAQVHQVGQGRLVRRRMARALADVTLGPVDALQQRFQTGAENVVIVRAAQAALGPKFHVLDAAGRANEARQFIGHLADVLSDKRVQNGRQVQFLVLKRLFLFRALLAQVPFGFLAVDDAGEMNRGHVGTRLALHATFLRQR